MSTEIKAPMTGKIASIVVHVGDQVNVDDEVVIMDAMKMEIPVYTPVKGRRLRKNRSSSNDH
jgi:acetyl-CoA carboxylase biotin carboxyl carrier protein